MKLNSWGRELTGCVTESSYFAFKVNVQGCFDQLNLGGHGFVLYLLRICVRVYAQNTVERKNTMRRH